MNSHTTRTRIAAIIAACAITGGLATACTPPEPKTDDTTQPETTQQDAAPAEAEVPADTQVDEGTPPEDTTASPGDELETWWLGQYDAASWSDVSDTYGGWYGHVLDMGGTDDTIVIVTNLDGDNPDGKEMAEGIVKSVQNQASINGADMPASVRDNVKYVQVFDAAGNLLANGGVEFE
ncbi:hypothetical protein [Corynebacterium sp.]|uniref:hypothetical protein n=1 Tax=Corynebacterium sp. TaxID=1720 RepID=UPI0026DBA618|nr:hypothetical protein [Corynebacterium sp.]MDO4610965.1 hypothetical protein [Corynebacterium sp.]